MGHPSIQSDSHESTDERKPLKNSIEDESHGGKYYTSKN